MQDIIGFARLTSNQDFIEQVDDKFKQQASKPFFKLEDGVIRIRHTMFIEFQDRTPPPKKAKKDYEWNEDDKKGEDQNEEEERDIILLPIEFDMRMPANLVEGETFQSFDFQPNKTALRLHKCQNIYNPKLEVVAVQEEEDEDFADFDDDFGDMMESLIDPGKRNHQFSNF